MRGQNGHTTPGEPEPDPWVPEAELRRLLAKAQADLGLLEDVYLVRSVELDET